MFQKDCGLSVVFKNCLFVKSLLLKGFFCLDKPPWARDGGEEKLLYVGNEAG